MARNVVTKDRMRWVMNTFMPYKAPGSDGIYLICQQKGLDLIIKVYRGSVAMGHIPKQWRNGRVIIRPKSSGEPS